MDLKLKALTSYKRAILINPKYEKALNKIEVVLKIINQKDVNRK